MTAAWMLYATFVGAFVGCIALTVERVCAIWGFSRRAVWIVAIGAAIVLPLGVRWSARIRPTSERTITGARPTIRVGPVRGGVARTAIAPRSRSSMTIWILRYARRLETPARALWICSSLVVFGVLLKTIVDVARQRGQWTPVTMDEQRVWLASNLGPAVVGAIRPRIVLPKWALTLDESARELMLLHEREHIRAGDPRVLLGAALLLIALPWNAALWWMVRRLRLAIEVDCDARVIAAAGRRREYGMLLVAVGERRSVHVHLATSLAQYHPFLERRIDAMTATRPRRPLIASLPFAAVALAAGVAVAQTPVPPAAGGGFVVRRTMMDSLSTRSAQTRALVQSLLSVHYPELLNGPSNIRHVTFVLDANDAVVNSSASEADIGPTTASSPRMVRSSSERAGGFVAVGGGAAGTATMTEQRDTVRAVGVAAGAGGATGPLDLTRYGLGLIDRSLIKSTSAASYAPGVVGPNRFDVYIVRLNTTASGKP